MDESAISQSRDRWQFWIDRGGTFTDIIGSCNDGQLFVEKILSQNRNNVRDAATEGIRRIMRLMPHESIPADKIDSVKLGTTIATNALLERQGEPTVLVVNRGFADCLRIGYQNRPKIFARQIVLPEQLSSRAIEIDCRYSAAGEELAQLDLLHAQSELEAAYLEGYRALAVVLMHSCQYPAHEIKIGALAREIGFSQISLSHQASPLIKLIGRGDTTVADAYLTPPLRRYIAKLEKSLPGVKLLFMQSNGGLADGQHFHGRNSLLSGPAAGVVGAAETGKYAGFEKLITFDMGGTSTDVAHFGTAIDYTNDTQIGGVRIRAPMVAVHTVAAGGGSICSFDGARLRVGPQSAGADPGPASYRNGGPLTITDLNLRLGRLQSHFFPQIFGSAGDLPLDEQIVDQKLILLCAEIEANTGHAMTPDTVAEGFISIAVTKMADAIKQISIEKGHNLSDYALASFGGAGSQHACQIADWLGIKTIIVHPLAGALSALGIGASGLLTLKTQSVEEPLNHETLEKIKGMLSQLVGSCTEELRDQGLSQQPLVTAETIAVRYAGTDSSISIPFGSIAEIESEFKRLHFDRFGFHMPTAALTVESVSVEGKATATQSILSRVKRLGKQEGVAPTEVSLYCNGRRQNVKLYDHASLTVGQSVHGPAIVVNSTSTIVIDPHWSANVNEQGVLILTGNNALAPTASAGSNRQITEEVRADPYKLELFNHMFMSVAEQMGSQLRSTSRSVNIKERLDFSCAIFDQHGQLVANAPHIPVHLGSMSESVQIIIGQRGKSIQPGQAFATNNPYSGGTHLPDITVISPVFTGQSSDPSFFVASRGHHADLGGITPGSMPANSKSLEEEGVVIDNFLLVSDGCFHEDQLLNLLADHKYPARNPSQVVADLKAQVAANLRGERAIGALIESHGLTVVQRYMHFVQENAEAAVRQTIVKLKNGTFACNTDSGATIAVEITIDHSQSQATIDFSKTSAQETGNLNAPPSIAKAAVMYVFRTLLDDDIPLNDGFLKPIRLLIPEGSLLNPRYPAAVVAGNVETSQLLTDAIYGALNVMAASQGTMNNFTFGDEQYQYYETIAGGSGAGADFDGTAAVQTNMTNSRLTDPEILELRYPVLVQEFSIRRGSGGAGLHKGGDGAVRKIKFLRRMQASIISQRRTAVPFGLMGGSPGLVGLNYVVRENGQRDDLGSTATIEVYPGDTFVIETPGGGGFGHPEADSC